MEQTGQNDNVDGPAQGALFVIEGPDEDGCVWICAPDGRQTWCQNLGPKDAVMTVMADFLAKQDFGE